MLTTVQEVEVLSRQKWSWMAARDVDALEPLFHDQAAFVHMGATMTKEQELSVIESGAIHYQQAAVEDVEVRLVGSTAIVLSKLVLTAVVGGSEVTNPFAVTEIYVSQDDQWRLLAMTFTRLINHPLS